MTTDEQPRTGFTHPDQTGTWEPDWEELEAIGMQVNEYTVHVHPLLIRKIIEAYRRRQAERGIVEEPAALRARAERLRQALVDDEGYTDAFVCPACTLVPGDLADDIIAPVGEVDEVDEVDEE